MSAQKILLKRHHQFPFTEPTSGPFLIKGEVAIATVTESTTLYDLINGPDLSSIKASPIKIVKIGNGSSQFDELKSIIILDNADFIIVDKDKNIVDYITNSNPAEAVGVE